MSKTSRYPKLHIQSKNELAKHISDEKFLFAEALALINEAQQNHGKHWRDSKRSEPEKGKYVRSAIGTPLGRLLRRINEKVLAPHDKLLPPYIFGGIQGQDHIHAARSLLGQRRKRTLLALDIATFFEQVSSDRVQHLLVSKCRCSRRAARLIADICCVPKGPKGSMAVEKTIGRGFATSSRLAIWCNLDTFIALCRLVQKELRGDDPRLAIYVDDIGITASRVSKAKMEELADKIDRLLADFDPHQPLPSKRGKRKVRLYMQGMEHLGIGLGRSSLRLGLKTRRKLDKARSQAKTPALTPKEHKQARKKYRSLMQYKVQVTRKS